MIEFHISEWSRLVSLFWFAFGFDFVFCFLTKPIFWPWKWVAEMNAVIHWVENVKKLRHEWVTWVTLMSSEWWQSCILPWVLTMNLDSWQKKSPMCLGTLPSYATPPFPLSATIVQPYPLIVNLGEDIHTSQRKVWGQACSGMVERGINLLEI